MRALVTNKSSEHHNSTIHVKLLNYNYVFGVIEGRNMKIKVPFDHVEFLFDYEWEKSIIKYRDLLHISLGHTSSIKFYGVLSTALEEHFHGEIKNFEVLYDVNEKARRGFWYKKVQCIVNGDRPLEIRISGGDYADLYNINIEDMDIEDFKGGCKDGITSLRNLISMSVEKLKLYEKLLYNMEHPESMGEYKAIGGR